MTPEDALATLNEAAGRAALLRNDHIVILQAVEILRQFIEKYRPSPDEEEENEGTGTSEGD